VIAGVSITRLLIPLSYIQAWSTKTPWPDFRQIEQDLIIGGLFGIKPYSFAVDSDWYQGKTQIASFEPEELFGTKLRALLQRRKNRDLFDLYHGLKQLALDADKLITCFDHYLMLEGKPITRAVAEQRMLEKLTRSLTEDIAPLLPVGIRFNDDDALRAFEQVWNELIVRIKGEPWKLTDKVIEEMRLKTHPGLLNK
jgi:hypothetical protein